MSSTSGDKFQVAANLLKALSHPLRLELVCGLRHQPCTQTFIADTLGLPQSTVAQHLKVLRSEGLVTS
jgi:ArsR family transcriptional regulator